MGKVFKNKKCSVCGEYKSCVEVWGKLYCRGCYAKKPKRGYGHSGMIERVGFVVPTKLPIEQGLKLVMVKKSNPIFTNLYLRHYPKSKGIVGRQLNYLIERNGEILGIIGANSPPLGYKKFEEVFGKSYEKNCLNNNVFCLIKREKNLGTKVLKVFREMVKIDYEKKYDDELKGLVTFVEPPRIGAVYRADNWKYLGLTKGITVKRRGSLGEWVNKQYGKGSKKLIFVYVYKC